MAPWGCLLAHTDFRAKIQDFFRQKKPLQVATACKGFFLPFRNFAKKHRENLAKISSQYPPFRGDLGTFLGVLTLKKSPCYHAAKPDGHPRHGPANRRKATRKGEVNMTTPSTSELLVQEARAAERLRLLLLANECKTVEEFRQRLQELINRQ